MGLLGGVCIDRTGNKVRGGSAKVLPALGQRSWSVTAILGAVG